MPLIILFFALSAFAQGSAPDWLKESWRTSHFPKSEWYIGFATDKIGQADSKEYLAIEASAKNKLSESIMTNVQSSATIQTGSKRNQSGEILSTSYDETIKTTTNSVLANIDVKSYFDKKAGEIYAFAAVKKKELASFYRANINSIFSFAEKEFAIAEYLAEQGKKNSAFGKIRAIEDSLKNVSYWGSYLQAVESDNSYVQREKDFWQRLSNAKMSLENSTSVYLNVSGVEDPEDFAERLSAQMQEKQCNCAMSESASDADYVVQVKAKLNRCIENNLNRYGEVYCYASANVSVDSPKYKRPLEVTISEAKGGWMNGNKGKATEEAFKELTKNIAEKIIQTINK